MCDIYIYIYIGPIYSILWLYLFICCLFFFCFFVCLFACFCDYTVGCIATETAEINKAKKRLGYVCNPRSLKEGTETSRRMTDELGSRQRDLSTLSVTKRANGHWHAIIASSCRWSQREYKRQPVHRINHVFAEEPSRRPGRPAVVQQLWRRDVMSPFPPSGNEGYIRNRDVLFQSVTPSLVGWPTNWDPYQSATGAAPSSALCRPPDPSYKADDRTGLHRGGRLLLSLEQPKQ